MRYRIPSGYNLYKILEELLEMLQQKNTLDRSQVNYIIDKGKPESDDR
ncbi:MAG TPA: hypothetical protein VE622_04770 [Nitrososphaeraceae archaeon]|jgi:hypothetical protein|nr:hypothetical protein [Nitrososphaeraceae archaeon]